MKDQENRREETKASGEISLQASPFLRWLDNFWYHYKWQTLGIAFAVIVLLVCVLQTCSKEDYDLTVVYAGPASLTDEEYLGAEQLLEVAMPRDFDENGEKNAALARYTIYSEDQIKQMEEDGLSVNRPFNVTEHDNYSNYLLTGEASVYLLDPWLYESLKGADRLRAVDELCETVPDGTLADGFGVRLGDTELYQSYGVLQVLPEDTVICLLRQQVLGKSHDDKAYANEEDMFCALIGVKE